MDALEAIFTRRSIRKYKDQEIPDDQIKILLSAAMNAPTAMNQKPWVFVVIDKKEILDKIPDFHPNASMLKNADKAVLICGDKKREKIKNYWALDCSAATENLLIAARALDIGACWLGIYPRDERIKALKKLLSLPDDIIPFSLISLGIPDEESKEIDRFEESRIHYNKW
jgi:nitroreductase